uniref:Uncharacterized protein n=1 Tax=Strigamia maritima TaxID=126957 RepID=T1JHB6_STRMM
MKYYDRFISGSRIAQNFEPYRLFHYPSSQEVVKRQNQIRFHKCYFNPVSCFGRRNNIDFKGVGVAPPKSLFAANV